MISEEAVRCIVEGYERWKFHRVKFGRELKLKCYDYMRLTDGNKTLCFSFATDFQEGLVGIKIEELCQIAQVSRETNMS